MDFLEFVLEPYTIQTRFVTKIPLYRISEAISLYLWKHTLQKVQHLLFGSFVKINHCWWWKQSWKIVTIVLSHVWRKNVCVRWFIMKSNQSDLSFEKIMFYFTNKRINNRCTFLSLCCHWIAVKLLFYFQFSWIKYVTPKMQFIIKFTYEKLHIYFIEFYKRKIIWEVSKVKHDLLKLYYKQKFREPYLNQSLQSDSIY